MEFMIEAVLENSTFMVDVRRRGEQSSRGAKGSLKIPVSQALQKRGMELRLQDLLLAFLKRKVLVLMNTKLC